MMIGEETRKISYEVVKAHHDFIMEYAIKPNAVFIGIKQQQLVEKENKQYLKDRPYYPFHPKLESNGTKPILTCIGLPVYIIDEPDHISVGLVGKANETN